MLIGTGPHTYEWIDGFGELPAGKALGYTHGVVTDARDNVYVHNQSADAVCVFDRDGNFIKSWGERFKDGAHGLFLSREAGTEYLYITDYVRQQVEKTTLDGETVFTVGIPPRKDLYPTAEKFKPTDVCVAPDGTFYMFDGYGLPYVHRYTRDAKYIDSIGGPGSGEGQLNCPHGGWVDTRKGDPELYVADRGNHRIQVFTLDGKHKRFITAEMKQPCCFFQWRDEMYVPDLQARVTVLGKDDRPVAVLGDAPEMPKTEGWPNIQPHLKPGKFSSPHACCVDSRGDVYVAEWVSTGRVTKLQRQA
jgi:DNA-binding beta-propeller fold protein YncE